MVLASTWTLLAIDTQDADLRLTRLMPWGPAGLLTPVGIQSSTPPLTGTVSDLLSDGEGCTFAARDVRAPSFAIHLTFAEPTNVYGVRFAGPTPQEWPMAHALMANGLVSSFKAVPWLGVDVLSPAPTRAATLGKETGAWFDARGAAGYREVAASEDGQVQLASVSGGLCVLSLDGGAAWVSVATPGSGYWMAGGVSGDGDTLAIALNTGHLWVSKDRGATWFQTTAGSRNWQSLSVNGDGSVIFAASGSSGAHLSRDGGATWVAMGIGNSAWLRCAVSTDGQTLLIAPNGNQPRLSRDGGVTWSAIRPTASYASCALADDGQTMLVGGSNGLQLTKDNGLTWVTPPQLAAGIAASCGVSSDGQIMACGMSANAASGVLWLSVDGGVTWTPQHSAGSRSWSQSFVTKNGLVVMATSSAASIVQYLLPDPLYVQAPPYSRVDALRAIAGQALIPQGFGTMLRSGQQLACDVESGGTGAIYGYVELYAPAGNTLLPRRVRLHRSRDGLLVREAWSDAQGNYRFDGITDRYKYDVIAWDHEGLQQSVVANDLTPEPML